MRFSVIIFVLYVWTQRIVSQFCTCPSFLPYGVINGDSVASGDDSVYLLQTTPSSVFTFYGTSYNTVYISTNGVITFQNDDSIYERQCNYPLTDTAYFGTAALFIYWTDIDETCDSNNHIWYRISYNSTLLQQIDSIINGCVGDSNFTTYLSLIATWDDAGHYGECTNSSYTFQAILAGDGQKTYLVTLYEEVYISNGNEAGIGGQTASRDRGFNHPYSCENNTKVVDDSNIGCPGVYIVEISDDPSYGNLTYTNNCDLCENNSTCATTADNVTCECIDGYDGRYCERDIDECLSDPCKNNATCVDGVSNFTCMCADGFSGHQCETDIDDCLLNSCENNATCVDVVNNYTCSCLDGFEGRYCELDTDDCLLNPCENNATCVDTVNNYTCSCVDGFEGRDCETDIDDCIPNQCKHGSTCVDAINNYTCTCVDGYTGRDCEIDIDECRSHPCQNGATCTDGINSYSCQCEEGWSGIHCEADINECLSSPCLNGGSCQNTLGSFKCSCTEKWAGTKCQIQLVFDPEVNSVSPNKGPVAGGTRITVRGDHLPASDPIVVHIGTLDCITTQQNSTTVIALTPPVNESDASVVGVDLPVNVEISGGKVFSLTETFVYKGNPKIESFRPTETIVKGGTQITVSGEDLDAVAAPAVTIIVTYYKAISKDPIEYNVTTTTYEAPCQVKDVTEMQCRTPQIELPDDFKIDTDSVSENNDNGKSRRKRSTDTFEYQSGDDKLAFHVGFKLDGVKDFENFSSIDVYPEPTFNFVQGSGDNVFLYKAGERLRFPGDSLDVGIMVSDYRIDIGKAVCGSLQLLTNSLSCAPPDEKPQLDTSNPEPNPQIIINVGLNVQHLAGYLEYPDTEQLHIVIPATILSVIVIITIILTACLLRRNRKQKQTRPQKAKRVSVFNGQADYYQYHEHHTSRYVKEPTNRIVPRRSTIHPMFCDPYHMMVTHNHRYRDHVHPKGLPRQDDLQDDVHTGHIVRSQGLLKRETVHNKNYVDKYCRDQRLPRQDISHKRSQELPRQDAINSSIKYQGLPRTATIDNEPQEMCSIGNVHRDTNNGLPRYNRHPETADQRQTHQSHRRGVVINDNVIAYQDVDLDNVVPPPPPLPPLPPPLRHDTEFYSRQLDRIH